jgi:uncharacterized tellurite resistance protein B-like protein
MLDRVSGWIKGFSNGDHHVPVGDDAFAETITALLVEAAMVDGALEDTERVHILALLTGQMEMSPAAAKTMLEEQITAHYSRVELHGLVRDIRSETEIEDRAIILEMIWVVVLADGYVDAHESQLMRRLAGLLYVDDVASGHAKKRALQRLDEWHGRRK